MRDADLYDLWCEVATIRSDANLRGEYTPEDLTRLEDIGHALARIAEEELRGRSIRAQYT